MNKGLHSKSHLKFFAYTFVLITSLFTFISCENFLQGEEVKEEITKAIEYNNAQAYTINVEALDGSGKIKTPAAGEVTKKVTDVFTIRFEPAEDHKFIKWEAIVKGMSTGEKASDYIEFENSESQETKVTLKKGSNQVIEIRPVCPPRLTYTFTQGAGDLYPRDTAIELNFNQKLSNCNLNTTPISYITIPNLDEGEDSEKYFKSPVVTDQKIIFRAETKEGTNFIPVPNNSRSVQVRIPKDEVWYVNKDYSEPIEVYLDSDIVVSYQIGTSTSAKTKVKYEVTEKNGQPLGTLKVNGNDNISEGSYSVGETISLRYWIPEGYSFNKWKFMDSKGEEYQAKDFSLTLSEQDSENNPIQLTFTIENQVKDEITIKPEIYDPIVIKFKKDADDTGTFKAGTTQLSLEEQNLEYAIGNEFTLSYKVPAGYFFYGWEYNSIGKKTEIITKDEIKNLGIDIVYDKDGDENGYDKTTRLATAQITIDGYTDKVISIKPVSFPNLEVTKFKLDNADNLYERDSDIVFTFNKTLSAACKDFYTIRIPGLPDGKTAADYFESAVLNGNTLTIKPKKATSSQIIPLLTDGTNTITVSLNAEKLYYETKTSDGTKVNVGLDSDKTYTYKINSETKEKTKIKVQLDSVYSYGTIKVNGVSSDKEVEYSIGNTVSLTFNLSKENVSNYNFKNWKLSRTYINAAGESKTEDIDFSDEESLKKLNIRFSYGIEGTTNDIPIYGATIIIDDAIDGVITVQPKLEYIEDVFVTISGSHGKFTPKGKKQYKIGQTNRIEFEPDSDFEFIRWLVVDANSGLEFNETEIAKYIKTETLSNEKADVTFIEVPEEGVAIELKPMIVERPQVISNSPAYTAAGVLRDTTIQVMFDYDMDEDSIYYTDEDLSALAFMGYDKLLSSDVKGITKYYGYEKDGETFYKNISIINSRNNTNLNDQFKAPVFENPRTLSIPVESLAPGLNIQVTIEKDFFRLQDGKKVSMSQAKKWLYLVNGDTDTIAPEILEIVVQDSSDNEITAIATEPVITNSNVNTLNFFKEGEFNLGLKIRDNTAPVSLFTVNLNKIYDDSYNKLSTPVSYTRNIAYTTCYGANAILGAENGSSITPEECKLTDLPDGVYSFSITAKDGSNNSATTPNPKAPTEQAPNPDYGKLYYFCLDGTPPAISAPSVSDGENVKSLVVSWDKSSTVDFKQAVIKWREWGSDEEDPYEESPAQTDSSYIITDLTEGTHYEIVAEYMDYAGNTTTTSVENGAYTRPAVPKNVTLSADYGPEVTVTGQKPDVGNCSNLRIRYRVNGSSDDWTEYGSRILFSDNATGSQTINPPKGYKYDFEVCAYDSEGDKYSDPYYTSGTTLPLFISAPNVPTLRNPGNTTNSITINWTKPTAGNCSGYIVYISTDSSFPNNMNTVSRTITGGTTTTTTFESRSAGTLYFYKVLSYYENEANTTATSSASVRTKCAPATNLSAYATSSDTIHVSWTEPTGNFVSYILYYKKHSASSYNDYVTINKGMVGKEISGLARGESYDFALYTIGDVTAQNNSVGKADVKTYPNAIQNFKAAKVSGSNTNYTVTWKAPASGNYDGYKYYVSTSLAGLSSATATTVAKTEESSGIVTLSKTGTANSILYIKVSTYYGTLETPSDPVCCSLALDPVSNLSASALSKSEIQLTWTNPLASGYDGLRIYRGSTLLAATDATGSTPTISKSATSYKATGLTVNTYYTFTVKTYKKVTVNGVQQELPAESIVSRYTLSTAVPSFSGTATGPTTVKLNWSYPETGKYNRLEIYRDGYSSIVDWWSAAYLTTTSYSYSVPYGGTSYTFRMKTTNGDGVLNEASSDVKTVTFTTPPSPVSDLTATQNSSYPTTRMDLSWTKPSGNYTGLKVYYKLSSDSNWNLFTTYANNTTTSCTVTGLTAGSTYDFKVESYLTGVSNIGELSETKVTSKITKPYAPSTFAISSRTQNSLTYSWSKPSGGIGGYYLYYKKQSDSEYSAVSLGSSKTSYTITGLISGTIYNVYLESYYSNTSNSNASSVKTNITPLAAPTNIKVVNDGDGTKVSWTNPTNSSSDTTDYWVYYKLSSSSSWGSTYRIATANKNYFKFSNTDLNNGVKYDFKIVAYNYVNPDYTMSADSSVVSGWTPPSSLGFFSGPRISADDGMGTITLSWGNNSGRTDIDRITILYGSTVLGSVSYEDGKSQQITVKIPNYSRGSSYQLTFRPDNGKGPTWVLGPKWTNNFSTSGGNIYFYDYYQDTGSWEYREFYYTTLNNVITSNYTISNNSSRTGGAFPSNRTVTLSKYSMAKFEVTQELYEYVMGINPSSTSTKGKYYPVTDVNWYHAIAFCNKLSIMLGLDPCYSVTGVNFKTITHSSVPTSNNATWNAATYNFSNNGFHLPTEAQWEFAARGGEVNTTTWTYEYAGSNTLNDVAWTKSNSGGATHQCGKKSSNRLSLYDMSGNVWEWLTDWNYNVPSGTFTDPYCSYNSSLTSYSMAKKESKILAKGNGYQSSENRNIDYNSEKENPYYKGQYGFRICRNVTY